MKSFYVIIFFSLISINLSAQNSNYKYIDNNIIEIVKERVDEYYVPSIVIGVIDSTKNMEFFSYGNMSFNSNQSVDENTIYEIGSDTKTFTTTLLSLLIEQGYLSLNDYLIDYFPDSIKNQIIGYENITIKDLATHTSGLPRDPSNLEHFSNYSEEKLFEFMLGFPLEEDSIKSVSYSNLGIGLLGYIMEKKMHKSYENLINEYICKEFKLNSTAITLTDEMQNRLAVPYSGFDETTNMEFTFLHACGALRSSAKDLLTYLSYQLEINETKYKDAIENTHIDYYKRNEESDICLAWNHFTVFADDFYSHGGRTNGYNSFLGFNKNHKIGVVVLCNSRYHCGDIGFYILSMHDNQLKTIDQFIK